MILPRRHHLLHTLLLFAALATGLSGCGVAYISTAVPQTTQDVTVIPLTPDSVARANATPYTPRALPAAFHDIAPPSARPAPMATPDPGPPPTSGDPSALSPPPDDPPGPYRLGIGDEVTLTMIDVAAPLRLTVQDDGAISVPDLARLPVAGLTQAEAERTLYDALLARQRDPAAGVEVTGFHAHHVTVSGAVRSAATLPITQAPLTLDTALAAAGGITAHPSESPVIHLARDGRRYTIPLTALTSDPTLGRRPLHPGDRIEVTRALDVSATEAWFTRDVAATNARIAARAQALDEAEAALTQRRAANSEDRARFEDRLALGAEPRDHVYLTGELTHPRRLPLPYETRLMLADVLFDEGGLRPETANPAQVYLLRSHDESAQDSGTLAFHLDGRAATGFVLATRMELRPGDVIFVAEQPITRWHRFFQQVVPSLISTGVAAVN